MISEDTSMEVVRELMFQKTNGVCDVCVYCQYGKKGNDGGRETGVQGCMGDDDWNGRVGNTAMYCSPETLMLMMEKQSLEKRKVFYL